MGYDNSIFIEHILFDPKCTLSIVLWRLLKFLQVLISRLFLTMTIYTTSMHTKPSYCEIPVIWEPKSYGMWLELRCLIISYLGSHGYIPILLSCLLSTNISNMLTDMGWSRWCTSRNNRFKGLKNYFTNFILYQEKDEICASSKTGSEAKDANNEDVFNAY